MPGQKIRPVQKSAPGLKIEFTFLLIRLHMQNCMFCVVKKVSKGAKIRNRYNQPH